MVKSYKILSQNYQLMIKLGFPGNILLLKKEKLARSARFSSKMMVVHDFKIGSIYLEPLPKES